MSTHTDTAVANPVSGQRAAVQVLADLIAQYPGLPAAHVTVHEPYPRFGAKIDFQVGGHEFEAWREALGIRPEDIELHVSGTYTWVQADARRDSVRVQLAGFTNPLTPEQAGAPRDLSEVAK